MPHRGKPGEALGLRDRKKAQQRLDLIEVAVRLFKKRGYEAVRMEDIASKAEVSTKTVYNYFPTKRDILIEFLVADRERAISEFERIIETPLGNPIDDLVRLMEADIGDVLLPGERALWLEIMAVTVRERGDERFRRYRHMFTSYFETLLSHFQEAGNISPSLDVALAAHIIHIVHSENFEHFCMEPGLTVEGALSLARKQLELLFRAWADDKPMVDARRARK
ncbi:TetR/AcrR family transcriptional regulator [Dongia soli]|uniref:TetR/AcrR family transcriptional regulator n=1 Tax=Dongia soli TaxID=600628 RepID=UPI002A6A603F|nr:helix-turn-helix domain-containing protein [Dongia soli]